jgi:3-oxoacyl-[acyl-carrier protein] reductase
VRWLRVIEGRVALVTGASSGIGKAIVEKFVENGAYVLGIARNEERLKKLKEKFGDSFDYSVADVSDYSRAKEIVDDLFKKKGKIDVLVNNAGIARDTLVLRMDEQKWDEVINVNLKGAFNYSRHVAQYMSRQKSGVIINISSIVGIYGNAGQVNYAASKAGIIGLTKSLAKELGKRGIRVVAVAPGLIETPMTEKLSERLKAAVLELTPLGRFGKPEEVANVVLFLSSDLASFITSTVVEVSGGLVI